MASRQLRSDVFLGDRQRVRQSDDDRPQPREDALLFLFEEREFGGTDERRFDDGGTQPLNLADHKEFTEIVEDGFGAGVRFGVDVRDEGVGREDDCVELSQLLQSVPQFVVHDVDGAFLLTFGLKAAHDDSEDELEASEQGESQLLQSPFLFSGKLQVADSTQLGDVLQTLGHGLPLEQGQIILHDVPRSFYI